MSDDRMLLRSYLKSLKLPKTEGKMTPEEIFQERMLSIESFNIAFYCLFKMFCDQRFSKDWDTTLGKIREWIKNHTAK